MIDDSIHSKVLRLCAVRHFWRQLQNQNAMECGVIQKESEILATVLRFLLVLVDIDDEGTAHIKQKPSLARWL